MSIIDEGNALEHSAHGWFSLRHKMSSDQQYTIHICLLLTPRIDGNKYTLIIFQMNRKKQYEYIANAHAKKEHFEDHMDIVHYDEDDYQTALAAYTDYVKMANELFSGRSHFWS